MGKNKKVIHYRRDQDPHSTNSDPESGRIRKRNLMIILKLDASVLQRENSARYMNSLGPGAAGDLLAQL